MGYNYGFGGSNTLMQRVMSMEIITMHLMSLNGSSNRLQCPRRITNLLAVLFGCFDDYGTPIFDPTSIDNHTIHDSIFEA